MAPNAALLRDSPTARWVRRSAPLWILLGIVILIALPGVLNGPDELDATSDNIDLRSIGQFASSDNAEPRARQMKEGRADR